MKLRTFFVLFLLVILKIVNTGYAQCPATCDFTYDGTTTNFNLTGGQTLCITANASSGLNLNLSGTAINTICIAPGATWTQPFGLNVSGNLRVNNYGTFNMNGSYNINGGGTLEVNNNAGATLNTDSQGFNSGVTIRNSSIMTWTATAGINNAGTFMLYNDTPTAVMTATATSLFKIGNGNTFENYGTFTVSNLENEEAVRFFNDASGKITIGRYFFNHGAFLNEGLAETICGAFGTVACEFIVGDKGPGKEYINSGCMKINGDVYFRGPGKLNGGTLIIESGHNLTIEKQVTGVDGRIVVKGGTSTITLSGGYNGTNMKFCDQNTTGNAFDVVSANNQATTVVYTVDCTVTDCTPAVTCTTPSSIQLTKTAPTCTGSTANNNGKITLTSASNTDKCGISAAGAATYNGPAYASATAYTANKDVKTAIPNTGGTYILRLFNGSDNCYKDTTITVAAVTCAAVDCNCTNNLITTPSFEGSDLSAWTQATNDPGGTILFSNDNPYAVCGSWYGYIRSANADAYNASVYQNVTTTAGTSFTLNVYAGTHDPGQDSQIRLQFFNASNTLLSGGQTVQVDTDVDVSPFTLGKYTLTGTAPSGTAYVRVTFYTQGTYNGDNMAFKFDQVCLQATACTQPSAIQLTKTAPTCTGSTANNNGKITLTSASNTDKCGISTVGAATYNGPAYATATAYVANKDVKTAIPNTGGTYILRLFNGSDNCYKDTTITVAAVTCNASCSIDITSATPSACSPSTNQYSLTVVVTYSNPPTGNIEISTSAGPNVSVAQTSSPQTITLTGFTANGTANINVSAAFVSNNACSVTKLGIYNAPASCSSPCNAPDCLGVTVKRN